MNKLITALLTALPLFGQDTTPPPVKPLTKADVGYTQQLDELHQLKLKVAFTERQLAQERAANTDRTLALVCKEVLEGMGLRLGVWTCLPDGTIRRELADPKPPAPTPAVPKKEKEK